MTPEQARVMWRDGYVVLWRRGRLECSAVGDPDCVILKRWTLKVAGAKLRLHRFAAQATDRDAHDHPWSFLTLVIQGRYLDIRRDGKATRMHVGSVRWRSAEHAHRTISGPAGATTLVLSMPERRCWGFWRDGQWLDAHTYRNVHGSGTICESS